MDQPDVRIMHPSPSAEMHHHQHYGSLLGNAKKIACIRHGRDEPRWINHAAAGGDDGHETTFDRDFPTEYTFFPCLLIVAPKALRTTVPLLLLQTDGY